MFGYGLEEASKYLRITRASYDEENDKIEFYDPHHFLQTLCYYQTGHKCKDLTLKEVGLSGMPIDGNLKKIDSTA